MLTFGWGHSTGGVDYTHIFKVKAASPDSGIEDFRNRLVSHLAVDLLPDAALGSLLVEIAQLWEAHQPHREDRLLESATTRRVLKGRIGKRFERPTFTLEEE